jgi:hypothetical protein
MAPETGYLRPTAATDRRRCYWWPASNLHEVPLCPPQGGFKWLAPHQQQYDRAQPPRGVLWTASDTQPVYSARYELGSEEASSGGKEGERETKGSAREKNGVFLEPGVRQAVSWLRGLLLRAGDVERNPGPDCGVCGEYASGRGPTCHRCLKQVHLKCSGMRRSQFYKLEDGGPAAAEWVCSKCGGQEEETSGQTGPTELEEGMPGQQTGGGTAAMPLPTENVPEELPEAYSNAERKCGVCDIKIKRGVRCETCQQCGMMSHMKCCGESRWRRERRVGGWRCTECRTLEDTVMAEQPVSGVPNTNTTQTQTQANEVMAQQANVDQQAQQSSTVSERCGRCNTVIRRGQGVKCRECCKKIHVACAGISSRVRQSLVAGDSGWTCDPCKAEASVRAALHTAPVEHESIIHGLGNTEEKQLVICQWNCDHIQTKIEELERFLEEQAIDVAVLQESKLRGEDKDPIIRGYNLVRRDRPRDLLTGRGRGGGVVTLVRVGIPFQKVALPEARPAEMLAVEVIVGRRRKKICNVYVPPPQGHDGIPESQQWVQSLPHGEEWMVLGTSTAIMSGGIVT